MSSTVAIYGALSRLLKYQPGQSIVKYTYFQQSDAPDCNNTTTLSCFISQRIKLLDILSSRSYTVVLFCQISCFSCPFTTSTIHPFTVFISFIVVSSHYNFLNKFMFFHRLQTVMYIRIFRCCCSTVMINYGFLISMLKSQRFV